MTSDQMGSLDLWLSIVREILGGQTEDKTLIDICCGEMTNTRRLEFASSVHIDIHDWPNRPKEYNFIQGDALALLSKVRDKTFDVALCSDGIEHLTHPDGVSLLQEMERVSRLSIIFTPLGEYLMQPDAQHPDIHKSGWVPAQFDLLGYTTRTFRNWHASLGVGAFFAWRHNSL